MENPDYAVLIQAIQFWISSTHLYCLSYKLTLFIIIQI